MKYRCRDEIINIILQTVMTGATRHKIMFEASISSEQAEEYLLFLQARELICVTGKRAYKITEKGNVYLSKSNELNELLIQ